MKLDKETQDNLQELQLAEQNLQNFLLQKQAFQIELSETDSALEETEKSEGEIYKITGHIMIKAEKKEVVNELKEKKYVLGLRVKSIEKQEQILKDKIGRLRKEIEEKLGTKKTK